MPKTEGDPLGPGFERRLRGELDRVQPRFSSPRYLARPRRRIALRIAPAVLAVSLVGILGLSAYAATGSPNPVVWTEHVVTVIHPNPTTTTPSATPQEHRGVTDATPSQQENRTSSPQPTQRPEPSDRAEPAESPEPTDHSGDGSGSRSGDGSSSGSDSRSGSSDLRSASD